MARPKSERVTAAAHEAVLELATAGVHNVSMEKVAALAGVNKTTLYRRWGEIDALLSEALLAQTETLVPTPDTGGLRTDLAALAAIVGQTIGQPRSRALFAAVLNEPADDQRLRPVLDAWWSGRTALLERIMGRAVDRGELAPTVLSDGSPARLLERLTGPIHLRTNVVGRPMTSEELEMLVTDLVDGLVGHGSAGRL